MRVFVVEGNLGLAVPQSCLDEQYLKQLLKSGPRALGPIMHSSVPDEYKPEPRRLEGLKFVFGT